MKFNNLLLEYSVSDKNVERSFELMRKYLENKLKDKLIRGIDSTYNRTGVGVLFVRVSTYGAVQFNFESSSINPFSNLKSTNNLTSIDIFTTPGGASTSFKIPENISIVKLLPRIADIMQNGFDGKSLTIYKLKMGDSNETLVEGRKAQPIVIDGVDYPSVGDAVASLRKLGYKVKEIQEILNKKHINTNSTIKEEAKISVSSKTLNNPNITDEMRELAKKYSNAVETEISEDQIFEKLDYEVNLVAQKKSKILFVIGMGGIGKTYNVIKKLKDTKTDYALGSNYPSESTMYKILYGNKTKVVLFDDCDNILKKPEPLNILKKITDTTLNPIAREVQGLSTFSINTKLANDKKKYMTDIDHKFLIYNAVQLGFLSEDADAIVPDDIEPTETLSTTKKYKFEEAKKTITDANILSKIKEKILNIKNGEISPTDVENKYIRFFNVTDIENNVNYRPLNISTVLEYMGIKNLSTIRYPDNFLFDGSIILITNKQLDKKIIDSNDMAALRTRGSLINIYLTTKQVINLIEKVLPKIEVEPEIYGGNDQVLNAAKDRLFKFFKDNETEIIDIYKYENLHAIQEKREAIYLSIREFVKCIPYAMDLNLFSNTKLFKQYVYDFCKLTSIIKNMQ